MGKIETAFHSAAITEAKSSCLNDGVADPVKHQTATVTRVGLIRHSHIALRRVRFLARFINWTFKHGSTANAAWVCNYEGLYW